MGDLPTAILGSLTASSNISMALHCQKSTR